MHRRNGWARRATRPGEGATLGDMATGDASHEARTAVIGAGIAGSCLAMHLAEQGDEVLVLDPDLAGDLSSSERNAGGVRATWWQAENVLLCARTIEHLRAEGARVGFRGDGYLWLYGPGQFAGARDARAMQNRMGRAVEILTPPEVTRRYPFISRVDGVAGATVSPRDGLVNPDLVRGLYRERARAAGAQFLDRMLVVGSRREGDGSPISLTVSRPGDGVTARAALSGAAFPTGHTATVRASRVVNAAGPWAGGVARTLGYRSPAYPCPREISVFRSPLNLAGCGMFVDTTGCYFHHEAGDMVLAGWSPDEHHPRIAFRHEGRAFFEREIWPRLAHRIGAMDALEYVRGWVGLYDLSPDRTAIAGAVPGRPGMFEVHGFSGRGVMQAHALTALVAELIVEGVAPPPLPAFSATRFDPGGRPLPEALHI
jgi:sarcosine oxidase, subunit beta